MTPRRRAPEASSQPLPRPPKHTHSADRLFRRSLALSLIALAIHAACSRDTKVAPTESLTSARGSSCHKDCWYGLSCRGGAVFERRLTAVPCDQPCPEGRNIGNCRLGCGPPEQINKIDVDRCPLALCRDQLPKRPGDACISDDECGPTRAEPAGQTETPDGGSDALPDANGLRQIYLRCDIYTRACVERQAPMLADWLGPCDAALLAAQASDITGHIPDPSCSGGVCVVAEAHQGLSDWTCRPQGCSLRCSGDDECPQGAFCKNPGGRRCPRDLDGVCMPGPRHAPVANLPCR